MACVLVIAGVKWGRHAWQEHKATEQALKDQKDPRLIQQRAVIEARTLLNVELLPDDGTFFPATGDIEVGSLLYTVHEIGPEKKRYYSEDAVLAAREKNLFVVRPILERGTSSSGRPESYRGRQSRSAETKRAEVKGQKKISAAELAEKYAARAGK